jgi:hypothetical protein
MIYVTPGSKAKTRYSSYICPGIICHAYNQNYSITENPVSKKSTLLQEYFLITKD